jgi:hypothetical protein
VHLQWEAVFGSLHELFVK